MAPRLAVFTKNRTNPAYAAARLGADRVALRFGATLNHHVPDKPDDVAEQIAMIDRVIAERPDAVVLVPVHETEVNAAIERLCAAGIALFTFITPVTAGRPLTFAGSDDPALGKAIAQRLFDGLGGRGRILIVEGTPASATSRHRMTGFQAALAAYPSIEVVGRIVGDYQRETARRAFRQLSPHQRSADGMLCANDVMALGVIDELAAAGVEVPPPLVVGVNAIPEAVDAVIAGRLLATAGFDAMGMCAVATEAACRHLRGERVPQQVALPVSLVGRDNAEDFAQPYAQRRLPDWDRLVG